MRVAGTVCFFMIMMGGRATPPFSTPSVLQKYECWTLKFWKATRSIFSSYYHFNFSIPRFPRNWGLAEACFPRIFLWDVYMPCRHSSWISGILRVMSAAHAKKISEICRLEMALQSHTRWGMLHPHILGISQLGLHTTLSVDRGIIPRTFSPGALYYSM